MLWFCRAPAVSHGVYPPEASSGFSTAQVILVSRCKLGHTRMERGARPDFRYGMEGTGMGAGGLAFRGYRRRGASLTLQQLPPALPS